MKLNYDKEADALYLEFKAGKSAKSRKMDDSTIMDLDKEGRIMGIEILDASKRLPPKSFSTIN